MAVINSSAGTDFLTESNNWKEKNVAFLTFLFTYSFEVFQKVQNYATKKVKSLV